MSSEVATPGSEVAAPKSEVASPELEVESQSDSSTLVYDHEPFETSQARALKLCQTVLPPADGKISIERMHGGGFNRIIGVSVVSDEHPPASQPRSTVRSRAAGLRSRASAITPAAIANPNPRYCRI